MSIPGCHNGFLTDPEHYFRSLVDGTSAEHYRSVLSRIEPDLNRYGIRIQKDSSGMIRPRLHLPTGDPAVWHDVDVEALPNPAWQWIDRGGPYAPYPCGGEAPPVPQPPSGLEARVAALEARVERHLRP